MDSNEMNYRSEQEKSFKKMELCDLEKIIEKFNPDENWSAFFDYICSADIRKTYGLAKEIYNKRMKSLAEIGRMGQLLDIQSDQRIKHVSHSMGYTPEN